MKKLSEVPELTPKTCVEITKQEQLKLYLQFLKDNNVVLEELQPENVIPTCFRITETKGCLYSEKEYYLKTGHNIISFEQFLELVKEEKYTVAQCREKEIIISVDSDEERKKVEIELSKLLNCKVCFSSDYNYLRVFSTHNKFGGDPKPYKSHIQISFNQLILTEMQDLDKILRISGKPTLIQAMVEDLEKLGYTFTVKNEGNPGFISHTIKGNKTELGVYDKKWEVLASECSAFQLPQDYVAALEFAKAQIEHLKKDKIESFGTPAVEFTIKGVDVEMNFGEGSVSYTKSTLLAKAERIFNNGFGNHKVEEVKIGCTVFTRSDYQQLLKFLN